MTRYLISFGAHAMDHIPAADMPAVRCAQEVWELMPDAEQDATIEVARRR